MKSNDRKNLDPHKPARFAMFHWHDRYAAQRGGSIDFWLSLSPRERSYCRQAVEGIEATRPETVAEQIEAPQ